MYKSTHLSYFKRTIEKSRKRAFLVYRPNFGPIARFILPSSAYYYLENLFSFNNEFFPFKSIPRGSSKQIIPPELISRIIVEFGLYFQLKWPKKVIICVFRVYFKH
jgi:hypothetical protein